MSKKFSAQRKRAFLIYLGQTGNVTLSAERAKVSRSWVRLHRSTDAEFDKACRLTIAKARERLIEEARLRRDPSPAPPSRGRGGKGTHSRWAYLDGHELVVRGTGGAGGGKRVQIGRAREKQWTPRAEKRFLAALGATCNVKAACAEVGLWPSSAYNHRDRWPAFAEAWVEAVKIGYLRIEAALIEAGCNLFSGRADEPDIRIGGMTAAHAIHLLHMHKHQVHRIGRRPGLPERSAPAKEIAEALQKRLVSFDAWLKRQPHLRDELN